MGVLLGGLRAPVRTVQITGTTVFFVMFFGSGAAIPRSAFPDWLRAVTTVNPMTPVVDASASAYLGDPMSPHLLGLGLVLVFATAVLAVAWKVSSWDGEQ
jgi:ABC-2 type transport system permease protein